MPVESLQCCTLMLIAQAFGFSVQFYGQLWKVGAYYETILNGNYKFICFS